jgi:hypothetical protein
VGFIVIFPYIQLPLHASQSTVDCLNYFMSPSSMLFPPLVSTALVYTSAKLNEWDHVHFVFPCLACFTQHCVLHLHPCFWKWQDFILFMAEQYSILQICCIFFITLSPEGHLDWLHILSTVNSAVINMEVPLPFGYIFHLLCRNTLWWNCWVIW